MEPIFSTEVQLASVLVVGASGKAKTAFGLQLGLHKEVETKGSHREIVTRGDFAAQEFIASSVRAQFPSAFILAEEKNISGGDVVTDETSWETLRSNTVFGVDGVDGTAVFYRGGYEWASCIGVMKQGVLIGGAIFAPDILGGMLVHGEKGRAVILREGGESPQPAQVVCTLPDKATILFSQDMTLLPQFNHFANSCGREVVTMKSVGSCAVGLAMVASGKADALVLPHQFPWDWMGGVPLVQAAGGWVQFYTYHGGKPVAINHLARENFLVDKRRTGVICGSPTLVGWLFGRLQECWGK